jgi:hypothetical protein
MGYLYVNQSGNTNLYKIGVGDNPDARRRDLQTGNPFQLVEIDRIETDQPHALETLAHNRLEPKRSRLSEAKEFFELERSELDAELDILRDWNANFLPMRAAVAELSKLRSEERTVPPRGEDRARYQRLREVRAAIFVLQREEERLVGEFKLTMGTACELDGFVTWRTRDKIVFDLRRFKRDHGDLAELYQRACFDRPFNLL